MTGGTLVFLRAAPDETARRRCRATPTEARACRQRGPRQSNERCMPSPNVSPRLMMLMMGPVVGVEHSHAVVLLGHSLPRRVAANAARGGY
jgi:hypothetical protein